jgi:phage terminase small subunit
MITKRNWRVGDYRNKEEESDHTEGRGPIKISRVNEKKHVLKRKAYPQNESTNIKEV